MSSKIKFLEKEHKYFSEDRELISVSKFTERFKEEVDWDEIARRSAAKATREGTPTTVEEIKKKWADKRDRASSIGTLYHSLREQEVIDCLDPNFQGKSCDKKIPEYNDGIKCSSSLILQNNTIYPEMMIYDLDHMLCGQSDKVIVIDNKIHIIDYKTDKSIDFKAYSSTWVSPRKLLPPLSHLEDCNGNLYSIKMSLYMYMLWKANKGKFKPGEIILEHIHLQRSDDGIPLLDKHFKPIELSRELIKLPYRKKEVTAMLKTLI